MKTWQIIVLAAGVMGVCCLTCIIGALVADQVLLDLTPTVPIARVIDATAIPQNLTFTPLPLLATSTSIQTSTTVPSLTPVTALPLLVSPVSAPQSCVPLQRPQTGIVSKVIDGDTIYVVIGEQTFSVRYIGVDSPEPGIGAPGSTEATMFNSTLVYGMQVSLYRDQSETDQYDRLLRYVFNGNLFVNLEMVKQGMAVAKEYPPDTACAAVFKIAEQEAQLASIGFWSPALQPTLPTRFNPPIVGSSCPQGCTTLQQGCNIKGNISSSGEKIYHMPSQQYYNVTKIDPSKGERWFCTEEEAQVNGWRKALQ